MCLLWLYSIIQSLNGQQHLCNTFLLTRRTECHLFSIARCSFSNNKGVPFKSLIFYALRFW